MQPRASRSSVSTTSEENNNFLDDEEEDDFMEDDENDEFDKPEGNFQMSQAITKDAASDRQERVNVQIKMKQTIAEKKLVAMKESEMGQQKLTFLENLNESMKSRDKREKIDDAEDRFVATIADTLRLLPHRERLLAKNKIKNTLF